MYLASALCIIPFKNGTAVAKVSTEIQKVRKVKASARGVKFGNSSLDSGQRELKATLGEACMNLFRVYCT